MLRELSAEDSAILREATLLNVNWNEERFSTHDVLRDPRLAHYTRLLPERGDFGYVLQGRSGWVSVVWLLFLDHRDPGFGYVRDGVPELSVCTRPGQRGRGHGRRLISHAIDGSRFRRLDAVTLSVEDGNPARRLYERLGFVAAPEAPVAGTMMLRLTR